jgi:formylmethanofuran dehydrogenase subunit D
MANARLHYGQQKFTIPNATPDEVMEQFNGTVEGDLVTVETNYGPVVLRVGAEIEIWAKEVRAGGVTAG